MQSVGSSTGSFQLAGTGISRGLQASLRQRPGVARAAELCQAAGGSCVALREEEKDGKHSIAGGAFTAV